MFLPLKAIIIRSLTPEKGINFACFKTLTNMWKGQLTEAPKGE